MSAHAANEIQSDFLTCKICKKPFNRPKTLPCLHTFCKACLVTHVDKHGKKGQDGTIGLFCPLCTQVCDLPKKRGVSGLPDNNILQNLISIINTQALQDCDLCGESGDAIPATYCCIKCESFLCDECAKAHKRNELTKDHMVINVGSIMDAYQSLLGKKQNPGINARLLTKLGSHGKELFNPISVCVTKADDILVSNDNGTITVFTLAGKYEKTLSQQPFYGSEENRLPSRCIDITSEGYIAVAMRKDFTPQEVQVGVLESLAGRETGICSVKTKAGADSQPHGIAITASNHIVVTDIGKHCVYVFDSELQMLKQFGKKGSRGRRHFKSPYFAAAAPNGDFIVSDYGNHMVKVFDVSGKPRLMIGQMGTQDGRFMHPMGICVDRFGNIFVADRDNHRVQMFDSQGRFISNVITATHRDGHDVRPQDVALTTYGHLVVLLKGIEGVNIAEVRVYQYGSRVSQAESAAPAIAGFTPLQRETTRGKKQSAKEGPNQDGQSEDQKQNAMAAPDLLMYTKDGYNITSKDLNSQVCVIL